MQRPKLSLHEVEESPATPQHPQRRAPEAGTRLRVLTGWEGGGGGGWGHLPDRDGLAHGPQNSRERPTEGLGAGPVPPHGHSAVGAGPAGTPQPDGPSSARGGRPRGAGGGAEGNGRVPPGTTAVGTARSPPPRSRGSAAGGRPEPAGPRRGEGTVRRSATGAEPTRATVRRRPVPAGGRRPPVQPPARPAYLAPGQGRAAAPSRPPHRAASCGIGAGGGGAGRNGWAERRAAHIRALPWGRAARAQ